MVVVGVTLTIILAAKGPEAAQMPRLELYQYKSAQPELMQFTSLHTIGQPWQTIAERPLNESYTDKFSTDEFSTDSVDAIKREVDIMHAYQHDKATPPGCKPKGWKQPSLEMYMSIGIMNPLLTCSDITTEYRILATSTGI